MSVEVRKILRKVQRQECWTNDALEEILSWHKSERRKWALGLLLKRKSYKGSLLKTEIDPNDYADGWNDYEGKFRKKIEEG